MDRPVAKHHIILSVVLDIKRVHPEYGTHGGSQDRVKAAQAYPSERIVGLTAKTGGQGSADNTRRAAYLFTV
ncbi:hypothetical protein LZK80_36590 (plasmid) [Rhizobium leguminosarum]|nr:hypothetical protein LZK80_36590 [Rhizobium leguminosarum]UIL31363.1 hypothetical protein LZK75_36785 [Rhizobium leguminosarum]